MRTARLIIRAALTALAACICAGAGPAVAQTAAYIDCDFTELKDGSHGKETYVILGNTIKRWADGHWDSPCGVLGYSCAVEVTDYRITFRGIVSQEAYYFTEINRSTGEYTRGHNSTKMGHLVFSTGKCARATDPATRPRAF